MNQIHNDAEFKAALQTLPLQQQRAAGALLVDSVAGLCNEERIQRALLLAKNSQTAPEELQLAHKSVKAASLDFHARCGADSDWKEQACYFIAKAAAACVASESSLNKAGGPAWEAALSCRMARTCLEIEDGETHDEAAAQYQIVADFLNT